MRKTSIHLVAGCLLSLGCAPNEDTLGPLPPGNNVLFIGNSLTYENDMPGIVRAVARSGGVELNVHSLALPNRALIDYLIDGTAQPLIARGGWKHIVMQQGPTTVPVCRDTLVLAVRALDQLGKRQGAQSIVMMSWPSTSRPMDFPAVHLSAQMAATEVGGLLAPVGDAWQIAMNNDASISLYGFDGYHPAPTGSFLAALVLYERITGRDARALPTDLSSAGIGLPLAPSTVSMLQNAAHSANSAAQQGPAVPWEPSTPTGTGIRC